MDRTEILNRIARGRTDEIFRLMGLPDWPDLLERGRVRPLQWLVFHDHVTAMKAVPASGGELDSLDPDGERGNAGFFGRWRMAQFLIPYGASPLTWASEHLRRGETLSLLSFGDHRGGDGSRRKIVADHGAGWGDGMDWNFVGDYLPESVEDPKAEGGTDPS